MAGNRSQYTTQHAVGHLATANTPYDEQRTTGSTARVQSFLAAPAAALPATRFANAGEPPRLTLGCLRPRENVLRLTVEVFLRLHRRYTPSRNPKRLSLPSQAPAASPARG